jgi:type II secretion system protein L
MATIFNNLTSTLANIRPANVGDRSSLTKERRLGLRLPHGWPETGKVDWCLYEGSVVSAHGSVEQLAELPADVRGMPAHVWSPAEDTLLTQVTLPTRSRSKITRALPFALEERLIDDPAEQFFTFERSADSKLAVSVTQRSKLQQWIATFDDAGLSVQSVTPVSLSISTLVNAWILHCDQDICWLRTGPMSGYRCAILAGHPPYMLKSALRDAMEAPQTLIIQNPPEDFDLEAWEQDLGLEILIEESTFWEAAESSSLPLNLLQQEFTPRRQGGGSRIQYLPAFYMVTAWLIGTVFFTSYEWWQLDSEYTALHDEMTAIFKKTFPQEASLIVDPYKQMQANLAQSSSLGNSDSDTSFLSLLGAISPILGRSGTLTLKEISYQADKLTASVELPDYRSLETVKNSIGETGLAYSVRQVHQKEGKVVAAIVLERK